ncbi:cation diffusion facilitator 1 [Fusarium subglutinans]|uniref:Cation diffusion facilitator 1 n=1 Tax=Gibberella subglutinans TaxID=42677 RepID=A0A8H5NQV7_GIBSU|nr:cation diffusion facilitator 1 [Fusarium subglutinans]KAF5575467.1 cation diffusion facilitator 1 [Fusarium subglutinans]
MADQTEKIAMSSVHARAHVQGKDVEVQHDVDDPLGLPAHIKHESNMPGADTSRKRHLGLKKHHPLQEFYETQNESIRAMLKSVEEHEQEVTDAHGANTLMYNICVKGSLAANIVLSGLQLYGAISSSSLSLFTTMADSVFDPMSGKMLYMAHRAVNKVDPNKYPSGRARISTAGNIVFSFIMFSVSLVLIVMSARDLAAGSEEETNKFLLPSVIAVTVAFATKLGLFVLCWTVKDIYSQVDILWRDHRNDLFINGFGILTSVGGSKLKWWIDLMGAIILSVLIAGLWLHTAYDEFQLMIGVTADKELLQLITYVSMTHSPLIEKVDTVRAYYSGPWLVAEVDIVIDRNERVEVARDVAEDLQIKLEKLPVIERAFVHIDYETSHKPEHNLKKLM